MTGLYPLAFGRHLRKRECHYISGPVRFFGKCIRRKKVAVYAEANADGRELMELSALPQNSAFLRIPYFIKRSKGPHDNNILFTNTL